MSVPRHFLLSVRGTYGLDEEIWQYGLRFGSEVSSGPDLEASNASATDISAALSTFHGASYFATNVVLREWRLYTILTTGRVEQSTKRIVPMATPRAGTASSFAPFSVACAVTFKGADFGPARHGRCFLPTPALAIDNTGRWTVGAVDAIRVPFMTMVRNLANAIENDPLTSVSEATLTNASELPAGTGTLQRVVTVGIGRVPDTMRSRRNKSAEERVDYVLNP